MNRFCGKCGSRLDEATGLCPRCDAQRIAELHAQKYGNGESYDMPDRALSKREEKKLNKEYERHQKRQQKEYEKQAKRAAMTTGEKIGYFVVKLLVILLVLEILMMCAAVVLAYFDVTDIPRLSELVFGSNANISEEKDGLYGFTADETYFVAGYESSIKFTVTIDGYKQSLVNLCSVNDGTVCSMHDDGLDGDAVADDGTYTCILTTIEEAEKSVEYYASTIDSVSETITVYFFAPLTEEAASKAEMSIKSVQEELMKIESNYEDEQNHLPSDSAADVMEEVEKYLAELYSDKTILLYEVENNSAYIKFTSGLTLIYEPTLAEDVSMAGSNISLTFSAYQPNPDISFTQVTDFVNDLADDYSLRATTYEAEDVTLSRIKSIPPNQVVFWHGHGGYGPIVKSFLSSGEYFDWSAWWWDITGYFLDCVQDRIIRRSTAKQDDLACITSKFIDYYCGDLKNDLIVLASCHSGQDDKLASSFINKGATAVLGFTDTVYTAYALNIGMHTLAYMTWDNPNTNNYYTLSEALSRARFEFGNNDIEYANDYPNVFDKVKSEIAEPIIFGGKEAEDYSLPKPLSETDNNQRDELNLPAGAVEFNGHYYYLYDPDWIADVELDTWEKAADYCQSQGGYMATITSDEENEFLFQYMSDFGYESAYFGLTDKDGEGAWAWSNGEAAGGYVNWADGEPNGGTGENYAMFYYKYTDGTWNDGSFNASDGGMAFICEWGDYTAVGKHGNEEPQDDGENDRTLSTERDIVLVLDVSGSMAGTPIDETRKASVNFIDTILNEDASIGVVTYEGWAEQISDFSVNKTALESAVSGISDGGGTNIEAGLSEACAMLEESGAKKKIIVLMSDGEPNEGREGEALISYADEIKEDGILIYTLGFFESLGGEKSSAQYLMEKIASDGCHYEVANADDLVFFFDDVADQINGQRYIYIRIACPVDVSVHYDGETLNSSADGLNTRTSFGTLSFEDSGESSYTSDDDRIKVLRLKEGVDYDIQIVGTGRGMMDYTIAFMDEEGEYSDFRRFEDIKITRRTVIDTVASVSDESILNIDEDGDGKYDVKLRAEENGYGEETGSNILLYAVIGGGAVIVVVIISIILIVNKRRKERTYYYG